jgi:uncharacterized Zn-binding protein involved in type VI secretion
MPPAARLNDMHTCPMATPGGTPHVGGPIIIASPDVQVCFLPAARMGDKLTCAGEPDTIIKGSSSVQINYKPAARLGDPTIHGGVIIIGAPTVDIGG